MSLPLVVMGASLGGLHALGKVLEDLPAELPAAVAIVQHRMEDGSSRLAQLLSRRSALPLDEAGEKTRLVAGHAYLAPAGYHMLVEGDTLALSLDGPVGMARPSIDVLFESAADAVRGRLVAVLLTAASEDGARGMEAVARNGGATIVQDPEEAESPIGPKAAMARVRVDHVLPLARVGAQIVRCLQGRQAVRTQKTAPRREGH